MKRLSLRKRFVQAAVKSETLRKIFVGDTRIEVFAKPNVGIVKQHRIRLTIRTTSKSISTEPSLVTTV
jgi:hypothetical protein